MEERTPAAAAAAPQTIFTDEREMRAEADDKLTFEFHTLPKYAIYHHPACSLHKIAGHVEKPARVDCILRELKRNFEESYFRLAPSVTDEQILRFHTRSHLDVLKAKLSEVEEALLNGNEIVKSFDSDTMVMSRSREAIYRAAGSVVAAVDSLYGDKEHERILSAFCAVRPPGHHAERKKVMGFCFLNNAGIAALHAKVVYGIRRVAVLDFDVHHGNGTEDGFKDDVTLFYGSSHEKDNYPGTGNMIF